VPVPKRRERTPHTFEPGMGSAVLKLDKHRLSDAEVQGKKVGTEGKKKGGEYKMRNKITFV